MQHDSNDAQQQQQQQQHTVAVTPLPDQGVPLPSTTTTTTATATGSAFQLPLLLRPASAGTPITPTLPPSPEAQQQAEDDEDEGGDGAVVQEHAELQYEQGQNDGSVTVSHDGLPRHPPDAANDPRSPALSTALQSPNPPPLHHHPPIQPESYDVSIPVVPEPIRPSMSLSQLLDSTHAREADRPNDPRPAKRPRRQTRRRIVASSSIGSEQDDEADGGHDGMDEQVDELSSNVDEDEDDGEGMEGDAQRASYRLGFDVNQVRGAQSSSMATRRRPRGTVVDLTHEASRSPPGPSTGARARESEDDTDDEGDDTPLMVTRSGTASRAGTTSRSAIVIQASPTPPLRPLASPQARAEALREGKCGVLADPSKGNSKTKSASPAKLEDGASPGSGDDDAEQYEEEEDEDEKVTLGEFVCPICLGPPTPLVVTECGHAFCGPCLHSALTSQPITYQSLQAIPTIDGKNLEGTCPVCRHVLRGGWGRALRGALVRVAEIEVPL